jgi:hypothetical protein
MSHRRLCCFSSPGGPAGWFPGHDGRVGSLFSFNCISALSGLSKQRAALGGSSAPPAAQVRRTLDGGFHLRAGEIADADHTDFAARPGLRGSPFDEVVHVAVWRDRRNQVDDGRAIHAGEWLVPALKLSRRFSPPAKRPSGGQRTWWLRAPTSEFDPQLRPLQPAIQLLCAFEKLLSIVTKILCRNECGSLLRVRRLPEIDRRPKIHRRNLARQRSRLAPKVLHLPEEEGS